MALASVVAISEPRKVTNFRAQKIHDIRGSNGPQNGFARIKIITTRAISTTGAIIVNSWHMVNSWLAEGSRNQLIGRHMVHSRLG
jgi:hypothetical protein